MGGAKQVAVSFLLELTNKNIERFNIFVSKEILNSITDLKFDIRQIVVEFDSQFFNDGKKRIKEIIKK